MHPELPDAPTTTLPLLSILVPVFNEARTVAAVLERLFAIELPLHREVLVVNDGSTDGTRDVLERWRGREGLQVLHAERNGGKGTAVRLALAHANGDIVAIQDADLELDPAQLATLVEPILAGTAAVVYGSRFLVKAPGLSWQTRAANRFLTELTNLLYGASLSDMETCYKVMRTDVARGLQLRSERFEIEPEITAKLLRSGHRIVEVPVRFQPRSRSAGKKIGWHDGLKAIEMLVRLRVRRPGSR